MTTKRIEQVLEGYTPALMSLPGVVGTGIGKCDGEPCIRVFVTKKTQDISRRIPTELDGYTVDVQESGQFRARTTTP